MNRQKAVKERVKQAFAEMLQETAPNLALPDTVDKFCEKFAKATTEIYDSRFDPIVLTYIAATAPLYPSIAVDAVTNQLVPLTAGAHYTFHHNLGYEPNVTIVSKLGHSMAILQITDTIIEIYNNHSQGDGLVRVVCS